MFVRFQFDSSTFAELVRDQIARSDVGCIKPTGSGFVVEHIEFPAAGPLPIDVDHSGEVVFEPVVAEARVVEPVREPVVAGSAVAEPPVALNAPPIRPPTFWTEGYETIVIPVATGGSISVRRRRLLLTLPVALHVRSLDQVITNSGQPFVVTIDARLHIDLVHHEDDGKDFVRVGYDSVGHRDGNDPAVEQLIRDELAGTSTTREAEFSYTESVLEAVQKMGGGGAAPRVVWSGMTLSPDRHAVEMRLEVTFGDETGTTDPDAWRQSLGRQIDDFRTDHDWAVEIGRDLLDVAATAGAHEQVTQQSGFQLAGGGPYVEWRPDYPGFRTTFTGEITDACSCFGFDIDLNVSVAVTTKLRLAQAGSIATIEVDSVTSGDATNGAEEACCAVTGALLFPVLGWVYLAEGKIGWGGLALGMFVPIIGGFITMWKLFDPSPEVPLAPACRKEGDHQICSYPVSLNPVPDPCNPASSTVTLDLLRGRNAGLVLAGSIQQYHRSPPSAAATTPTPFEWHGPQATCTGTIGKWSARSQFTVVQVDGGFPLEVCDVIAVGQAAAIYKPWVSRRTTCPSTADVVVDTVEWTIGNPDPQPVIVLTNVGAMAVMLPPLPARTEQEEQRYEHLVNIWRRTHCGLFDPGTVTTMGRVEARWMVDGVPGRDVGPTRRLWVIRAGGIEPGEAISVAEPDGTTLAIGEATTRRGVRIDLLHDGETLHVSRRLANGERNASLEGTTIEVRQLLLEELDVRTLDGAASGLHALDRPGQPAIAANVNGGHASLPLDESGHFANGRVAHGWRSPALAALAADDAPGVTAAVRRAVAEACGRPGDALEEGRLSPTVSAWRWLLDRGDEGWCEVDVRSRRITNQYRHRPWFDGLVYIGRLFARLDDDGSAVRTYRVLDTASL